MDPVKVNATINIVMGLIKTGVDIYDDIQNKQDLTKEDLEAAIDRINEAQAKARAELVSLIGE